MGHTSSSNNNNNKHSKDHGSKNSNKIHENNNNNTGSNEFMKPDYGFQPNQNDPNQMHNNSSNLPGMIGGKPERSQMNDFPNIQNPQNNNNNNNNSIGGKNENNNPVTGQKRSVNDISPLGGTQTSTKKIKTEIKTEAGGKGNKNCIRSNITTEEMKELLLPIW